MKKTTKIVLWTLAAIIAAIFAIGGAVWLIGGRSPQAILVSRSFHQTTLEEYTQQRGDTTDKSTVAIPDDVEFPREMSQYRVGEMQVFHMEPEDDSKPIVLYIHGGAYIHNFTPQHWTAMAEWAKSTGCGIVAPNYPLLYRYTAIDAHPLMMTLYLQLVRKYTAKRVIIMGDSAGGGLALALSQGIRTTSLGQPSRLVLISPWVDVLGGDDKLQQHDTFLNVKVLRKLGADWAGPISPKDPIVSPLYGDMQELPSTDVYTGTWEVFYTDIVKACDKMKAAGVDVRLHVAEKMGHVYPLWPCPEGKKARKEIADIILNK